MSEHPKMQAIMDTAYEKFTDAMRQKDFYACLTEEEAKVVFIGNLNYQVTNGGFMQWYDNGYHVGVKGLLNTLVELDTAEAKKVAGLVRSCMRRMESVGDEDESVDLSDLDDEFYEINEIVLSQVEARLS